MIEDAEFTPELLAQLREELSKVYPAELVAGMTDEQLKGFVRAGEQLSRSPMLLNLDEPGD